VNYSELRVTKEISFDDLENRPTDDLVQKLVPQMVAELAYQIIKNNLVTFSTDKNMETQELLFEMKVVVGKPNHATV